MSRYPYTRACDYLRSKGYAGSRADAAGLMRKAAEAMGMDDEHRFIAECFAKAAIIDVMTSVDDEVNGLMGEIRDGKAA